MSSGPSENKSPSIPPPFSELAMPSADNYYDLSEPSAIMEAFPEYRGLFISILERSETIKQAVSVMLSQLELDDRTKVTGDEIENLRKRLAFVTAINSRKERGSNYLQTAQL